MYVPFVASFEMVVVDRCHGSISISSFFRFIIVVVAGFDESTRVDGRGGAKGDEFGIRSYVCDQRIKLSSRVSEHETRLDSSPFSSKR
jgi:hypothetical protein